MIKIYSASADTTITNSYKSDMITRGTGSNMGSADILEVFSLYGQASGSSDELARILVSFKTEDISADRTSGHIPSSGSVDFILKLYNAPHSFTLPKNYTLEAKPVLQTWQEGRGLDMDEYKDETYESEGANWIYAASGSKWLGHATNLSGESVGGSFFDDELADNDTTDNGLPGLRRVYKQDFVDGTEDLEINVTELVEEWMAGTISNYGFIIKLSGTYEAYVSGSNIVETDGVITGPQTDSNFSPNNITGSQDSFYTKKFFARSSQYFYKTPRIEARWDDSKKDDTSNFYVSSALAPELDNVNTIYLYNYVRGQLQNIPAVGDSDIYVAFHTGSGKTNLDPVPCEIQDLVKGQTSEDFHTFVTGGYVSTGIYSASVVVTSSLGSNNYYFPVWQYGTEETTQGLDPNNRGMTTLVTGSAITAKTFDTEQGNPSPTYVNHMNNIKSSYSTSEKARLRLFVRENDWCPTIYTVAQKEQRDLKIIEDSYYKVYRTIDDFEVIPYGTGSSAAPQALGNNQTFTRLSFDVSGSYFDLDMSLLEPGYSYGIKFVHYINGGYREQSEVFKFRVEE
jgi:hypothetical protein